MLENWININNKPNLHRVQFCYYLDRFARHASCLFSIWFYHLLGCPDRWVTTETSGKQWQHSVWFIDLRIGWHGASSRLTFPWVTQLNPGSAYPDNGQTRQSVSQTLVINSYQEPWARTYKGVSLEQANRDCGRQVGEQPHRWASRCREERELAWQKYEEERFYDGKGSGLATAVVKCLATHRGQRKCRTQITLCRYIVCIAINISLSKLQQFGVYENLATRQK